MVPLWTGVEDLRRPSQLGEMSPGMPEADSSMCQPRVLCTGACLGYEFMIHMVSNLKGCSFCVSIW